MKVLIVDDEDDIRVVLRLALERLGGMQVLDASSGDSAVAFAATEAPDVIVLDVMMPGLDGPETLALLRADPRTARIPVAFLTAKAMAAEVERLRGLGAIAVFTKPFDPRTLPAALRASVEAGRTAVPAPATDPD